MSEPKEKLKYKSNNVLTDNDTVIESNVLGKFFPAVPFQAKSAEKNDFEEEINNETEAQENHSLNFSSAAPPDDRITNHLFPNIVRTDSGIQLKANSNYTTPLQLKPNKTKISSYSAPAFQLKTVEPTQNDSKEDDTSSVQNTSHSNSLPKDVLGNMEQMMGADFSGVNIHQNSTNAHNVGALAYTQGEDIHFAPGQFDPTSKSGKELIGHELTHVVQQRQGRVQPTTQAKGLPVNDDEGLEAEADEMGRQAAQMKANPDAPPAQMSLFGNEQERIRTKTGIKINNPTFDESRMRQELPRTSFTGAGDPRLAQAMTVLYSGATEGAEVEQSLRTIAEIRGLDVSTVNEQYNRAIAIRTAGRQYANPNGAANDANDPSPDLDLDRHPDFTGSLSQLRFGSTLGDVFGIDPVFGALISPTGGLVGPGNDSVSGDANNPTVLHGTVHDAAGYLLNAHGVGPGYNYLKRSWELDATNPLAGQTSGTAYWADRNPIAQATATLGTFGVNAVMDNPSILLGMIHPGLAVPGLMNAGRDYENNFIRSAVEVGGGNWASRGVDSISNTLNAGWNAASNLWDGVTGVASDVWDGARGVTSDVIGGMRGVASDVWSGARGVASDVWDGARGVTSDVIGGMRGVASDVWSGARGVASDVWDGARGLASGVMGGIGGALKDSGIGQPLTAPGLGGIASGLGRALSRAASGVGGALRDAGIGQPLTAPGLGGIVGGISRMLSGITGGLSDALKNSGIGQPLTAPGLGGLGGGIGRMLPGPKGGMGVADGIGGLLPKILGGLGLNGGISGGLGGLLPGLLGPSGGILGGLGGLLGKGGIGQPLTTPGMGGILGGLGGILGRLGRILPGITGGLSGTLKDSGIGQPLITPGLGGLGAAAGRRLSGLSDGQGDALRDAGIGQPLTTPGMGGILGRLGRILSRITGGLSGALKDSGIGQPLIAPGLDGLGAAAGQRLSGLSDGQGDALRYAGIGQPLTSPGMGGILSGLRRIINSIPEAKNVSANPTNHPGWDLPFDPFRIGGIGVPNNTPTHIPAGVGSKPEGDGYSTPWLYSGFKPSADGKYPIGYSGGFGLGRLAAPGNTNTYGAADINLGAWDDPDGGTRYGLGASAGAGKGSYDIPAIINSFYPGAMDKRNILNLDVGLGTAGADLSLNPDTGFSIGAQANIAEGAITAGTTDTGDSDKTYKLGLSEGVGAALRGHWGDKDKDGLREYGFGFDFGPLSVDMKTEDPLRDLGIGFIPGVGPALANLLPGGNLTEGLANKFGLTTRNATLADTWNLVSDTASDAWDGAKGLASDAWDSVTSTASDAWDGITNTASDAWDGVTSTASDAWDGAKGLASDAWDGAKSTASDAWDSATSTASDAWSGTKSIASDAWDGLKSLF